MKSKVYLSNESQFEKEGSELGTSAFTLRIPIQNFKHSKMYDFF